MQVGIRTDEGLEVDRAPRTRVFDIPPGQAIFYGALAALSSTAMRHCGRS